MNTIESGDFMKSSDSKRLNIGSIGQMFDTDNDTLEVSYTNLGHNNGYFLKLNTSPIIGPDNVYGFGFSVKRQERFPGIMNRYPVFHQYSRPYFSEMNGVTLSSGVLTVADQEEALDTLVAMILKDIKSDESKFFNAKKAYKVTWTSGAVGVITINGTTVTASSATAVSLLDGINAVNGVEAYLDGAATFIITTTGKGMPLTVVSGSHTAIDERGLIVVSTSPESKAIVSVDVKTFVPSLFSLVQYDYSGISATVDGAFDINYIKADKTIGIKSVAVASSAAGVTAVNGTADGLYASADGDILNIVNKKGVSETARSITYPYRSDLVAITNAINGGVFPTQTADDLFRLFAGIYNGMGSAVRQNQTIEGAEYAILNFTKNILAPGLSSGASSFESSKTRVALVIKKELLDEIYTGSTTLAAYINSVFSGAIS